jgi:hypothetical protein
MTMEKAVELGRSRLVGLAIAALCGLMLEGQTVPAKTDTATIHVYRPKAKIKGIALRPSIYCDGMELYRMPQGTFFDAKIPVGKHIITAGRSEVGQFVDLEAGKDYYFMLGRRNMLVVAVSNAQPMTLNPVPEDQAKTEMKGLKELGVK